MKIGVAGAGQVGATAAYAMSKFGPSCSDESDRNNRHRPHAAA